MLDTPIHGLSNIVNVLVTQRRDNQRKKTQFSPSNYVRYIIYIPGNIHWLQIPFQGRFWFDFCPFSVDLSMSKKKLQFQEKNLPLHVFIFES